MKKITDEAMAEAIRKFNPPMYSALPDMGLYLEQTTKYINTCLEPLGCIQVTGSMIRNYVKKGLVANPIKKQYYADHIAHLMCIAILKSVLSLDQIKNLFQWQQEVYPNDVAYDFFVMEIENVLMHRFGLKNSLDDIGKTDSAEKEMLRSAIIAVSHIIYLNVCFKWIRSTENKQ